MEAFEPTRRRVRHVSLDVGTTGEHTPNIDDLYDDRIDVISARRAWDRQVVERVVERLERPGNALLWSQPNAAMPSEDVHVLGTDAPATPTYRAPRGVDLETYLESAERHAGAVTSVFEHGFDPVQQLTRLLSRFSG